MDAIMEWGTALFFIWYGLAAFVPAAMRKGSHAGNPAQRLSPVCV